MKPLELIAHHQTQYQTVAKLAESCCDETILKSDDGACFELLCRAIEDDDEEAWLAIHNQYNRLVLHWIRKLVRCGPILNVTTEDLAQTVWLKFWKQHANSNRPFSRRFSHIGVALSYLRKCTITVCLEWQRKQQSQNRMLAEASRQLSEEYALSVIQDYLQKINVTEKVDVVRQWLDENIQDEAESIVVRLTYQSHLTPAEIVQKMPQLFAQEQDVYRIKQRIIRRARRALLDEMYD